MRRRRPVQKKTKQCEIEVRSPGGRTGAVGRDTWRHMWLPHRVEALAGKAFRQGFFWPTTLQDATALVTKCEACQFHSKKLHPLSNGQVERANAEVLRGLRMKTFDRLRKSGRRWIDELLAVLWSIRTTPNRATGQTPFALVYGAEAVLPTELIYGSSRVLAYDELE